MREDGEQEVSKYRYMWRTRPVWTVGMSRRELEVQHHKSCQSRVCGFPGRPAFQRGMRPGAEPRAVGSRIEVRYCRLRKASSNPQYYGTNTGQAALAHLQSRVTGPISHSRYTYTGTNRGTRLVSLLPSPGSKNNYLTTSKTSYTSQESQVPPSIPPAPLVTPISSAQLFVPLFPMVPVFPRIRIFERLVYIGVGLIISVVPSSSSA